MSKVQAGGEAAEGQDGCAEPVLAAPALAHRFALGDVKFSLVGAQRTLTITPTPEVSLQKVERPAGEAAFVAVYGGKLNNTALLGDNVQSVTIYCAGPTSGAVSLNLGQPVEYGPGERLKGALFGHGADGRRIWVYAKVSADLGNKSLSVQPPTDAEPSWICTPSAAAGPVAPKVKGGSMVIAGFGVIPNGVNNVTITLVNGQVPPVSVKIPTEQNPDNFGPNVDAAARFLGL